MGAGAQVTSSGQGPDMHTTFYPFHKGYDRVTSFYLPRKGLPKKPNNNDNDNDNNEDKTN